VREGVVSGGELQAIRAGCESRSVEVEDVSACGTQCNVKAEIVAGALQDHDRALIVGENSFGKGLVQTITPLSYNTQLKITTAKYYTPSHKVIHEEGITPDILVPITDAEERDILLQRIPGGIESLEDQDRERVSGARDPQLERAMDLLKGITVFSQRAPAPEKRVVKGEKVAAIQ